MKERIKSISDAFSMQPRIYEVTEKEKLPEYEKHKIDTSRIIKEINHETSIIDGESYEVYVGYNFDGIKLFSFLAKSVNIEYET